MKKTLIPLILIITIAGFSTASWAESASFKLSVTIPQMAGITNEQNQQPIADLAKASPNQLVQEKIFKNNQEIVVRSIVTL